jgi:PAS domain S-box-containing protein
MDQTFIPVSDSDSLLHTLLASSGDCIKILDLDGNLIFMTEGGRKIMEVVDFGAIHGCPWPDFWQGQGNVDAKAAVKAAQRGVSRDITAGHQAVEHLRTNEARFVTFAQAMPNQVWSATPDGQLDWFNDQVFAYSGFTFDDLVGNNWARMVHPEDIDNAAETWANSLSEGVSYQMEFRLRRADGSFRWHLARALPIRDSMAKLSDGSARTPISPITRLPRPSLRRRSTNMIRSRAK